MSTPAFGGVCRAPTYGVRSGCDAGTGIRIVCPARVASTEIRVRDLDLSSFSGP